MIPSWPSTLWQMPARGRWSGGPRDERAVFSPEIGPPISRRRTTGETRAFEATFPNFTGAMRAAFETWFRDALRGGVERFAWRDPVSGEVALWQVIAAGDLAYSFSALGADRHELSLNLLRLPGTPWWAPYVPAGSSRVPYLIADYAGGVFGVAGRKSAAATVAAVSGVFDVYTTGVDQQVTEDLGREISASVNLLRWSEDFGNGAWSRANVAIASDAIPAPAGAGLSDRITPDAGASFKVVDQTLAGQDLSVERVFSTYLRDAGVGNFMLAMRDGAASVGIQGSFDFTSGMASAANYGGPVSARLPLMENAGNGWWRCTIGGQLNGGTDDLVVQIIRNYDADGVAGFHAWGAQLAPGSVPIPYTGTGAEPILVADMIPAAAPPGVASIVGFLP